MDSTCIWLCGTQALRLGLDLGQSAPDMGKIETDFSGWLEPRAEPAAAVEGTSSQAPARLSRSLGWYVTFLVLAAAAFLGIGYFTGADAIAGTARFAWNALVIAGNGLLRVAGGFLALVAKGIGWRRLSRLSTAILSVGLGYSGSVLLSDSGVRRAKGWTGKIRRVLMLVRQRWLALHVVGKLAIVAALIASQLYLHSLLVLFPIAFLVPVVRRLWVQTADLVFGSWYWRTFGQVHRAVVRFLKTMLGVREVIGATRLLRLRYLYAWRLWKHDPRYRCPETNRRVISLAEPIRLWRRGELDRYVGRPLLRGSRSQPASL